MFVPREPGIRETTVVADGPCPGKRGPEAKNVVELPVRVNLTIPDGVMLGADEMSITTAVHVVNSFRGKIVGEQITLVTVG